MLGEFRREMRRYSRLMDRSDYHTDADNNQLSQVRTGSNMSKIKTFWNHSKENNPQEAQHAKTSLMSIDSVANLGFGLAT